ncbi:MAG: hypothetical protein J2P21_33180, partial [Chloracidobacterium sp.]|nr:hypothetical protein [Chloracidobacterium sp.]
TLGFVRHAINVEQASYGFIAHKVFGPIMDPIMSARAATAEDRGVRDYPYVGFIAHRTEMKFASFSWRNKIMGMIIPIGEGHEGNPDFTVPIQDGFVGSFEVDPAGDIKEDKKITVVERDLKRTDDGFETAGTLLLHSGRLQQKIKMTSIGAQTVIYEDEVTALAGITVKKELGIPFGIENDEITGGARVVTSRDARTVVNWRDPKPPMAIQGRWINVDGRLGVVSIAGSGLSYAQGSGYLPGISVCADKLYGSYFDRPRQFRAGDVVARRLAVFLVEVTPQRMSRLTESYRIDEQDGVQMLRFKQPDGKDCKVQIAFGRLSAGS